MASDRTPAPIDTVAGKFRRFYRTLSEDEQAALRDLLAEAAADPTGTGIELFGAALPTASLSDIWGPPRVVPVRSARSGRGG